MEPTTKLHGDFRTYCSRARAARREGQPGNATRLESWAMSCHRVATFNGEAWAVR